MKVLVNAVHSLYFACVLYEVMHISFRTVVPSGGIHKSLINLQNSTFIDNLDFDHETDQCLSAVTAAFFSFLTSSHTV